MKTPTLADDIRAAIVARTDLTQGQLARDSGVHQVVISRFLRGHRSLNLATAGKLCRALGLRIAVEAEKPAKTAGKQG